MTQPPPEPLPNELASLATHTLVERAALGDGAARDVLFERLRPRLVRWSHGRLPASARGLEDTEDLVQEVLVRSLAKLDGFQQRGGGFLSYLCTAVQNRIRNRIRDLSRRPASATLHDVHPSNDASPLEQVIGREALSRYQATLQKLRGDEQDLVIGRVEFEMSFADLALHFGKPSADAARMAFYRASLRLAEAMASDDASHG